ncbi:MAG: M23 family metallopeptidase [SAR324 cluster bacterium]|nr:M23 family metallopeptidase [SAR324 cluster bacterium]MCZ6627013.1 M23 family metallopeptidase [SAR324 cluster bacterium]
MLAATPDFSESPVRVHNGIPRQEGFGYPVVRPERITSPFGPRWKSTEERYDFHRGIDFYGQIGEPIFAVAEGEVFRVYGEGNRIYPNGGNTLIIRHEVVTPFNFHGKAIGKIYSLYLHLDKILVEAGEQVCKGQHVAAMGQSGSTRFTHLHFEIRLGTTCSLEYQRQHSRKVCAAYGFDPHVHPLLFIDGPHQGRIAISHQPGPPYVVTYSASRADLHLNEIATDKGLLNFNTREGIDATSTAAMDDFDFGWVCLRPERFSGRNKLLVYRLEFSEPPAFVQFTDIFGDGLRREFH